MLLTFTGNSNPILNTKSLPYWVIFLFSPLGFPCPRQLCSLNNETPFSFSLLFPHRKDEIKWGDMALWWVSHVSSSMFNEYSSEKGKNPCGNHEHYDLLWTRDFAAGTLLLFLLLRISNFTISGFVLNLQGSRIIREDSAQRNYLMKI